ncbi:transferase 2, rSAM/selenodomain-associated [Syntrophus gentianae]|uniref:Transferase 2, rSAM/selenodomain-associated n=2 Tax=Syntrophus gentianae TaxID=43775 RepID=A0A1H8A3G8_9BACT|nr:transferase 2, rSAM/selenodomain-associated [Syntrophus gentianae]
MEVIVVDGDSAGATIREIRDTRNGIVQTVLSEKGRGIQFNRGASLAKGEILLFLHVDTRLPAGAFKKIAAAMKDRQIIGGAFRLVIDSRRHPFRVIEKFVSYRSRYLGLPYGDQGIFVRKTAFHALGGFRNVPIMEDLDLMRRISKRKGRLVILDDPVVTSARRWEQEGILYCTLRNWCLVLLFLLGVPSEKLLKFYPSSRTAPFPSPVKESPSASSPFKA